MTWDYDRFAGPRQREDPRLNALGGPVNEEEGPVSAISLRRQLFGGFDRVRWRCLSRQCRWIKVEEHRLPHTR
jgi:hypothetical protein